MKAIATKAAAILAGLSWCAATPSVAMAQTPPPAVVKADPLAAEFDALAARCEIAMDAHRSRVDALYARYDPTKLLAKDMAEIAKLRDEIDRDDPTPRFLKEFGDMAERAKGTDVGAKSLLQVLTLDPAWGPAGETAGRKALATLLTVHLRSPVLADLPAIVQHATSIDFADRADAYRKLAIDGANDAIRAEALHYDAIGLTGDPSAGGDKAKARERFLELKSRFGARHSRQGRTYASIADGFLFELERLQLGMQAPDFEVTDELGVKFRLSDYAGKVVVVDFWGDW